MTTVKRSRQITMTVAVLSLMLAGCVSTPPPPDSSASHPANAQAAEGTLPPPVLRLLNITNLVMVKPVTEAAPQSHQHETTPNTEESKQ